MDIGIIMILAVVFVLGIVLIFTMRDTDDAPPKKDTSSGGGLADKSIAVTPVIKTGPSGETSASVSKPEGHYVSLYSHAASWAKRCPYCDCENVPAARACRVCGKSI